MKPATVIVHWPGKATAACDDHARKLLGLASTLGFGISMTQCEETICENCKNEEKK